MLRSYSTAVMVHLYSENIQTGGLHTHAIAERPYAAPDAHPHTRLPFRQRIYTRRNGGTFKTYAGGLRSVRNRKSRIFSRDAGFLPFTFAVR